MSAEIFRPGRLDAMLEAARPERIGSVTSVGTYTRSFALALAEKSASTHAVVQNLRRAAMVVPLLG